MPPLTKPAIASLVTRCALLINYCDINVFFVFLLLLQYNHFEQHFITHTDTGSQLKTKVNKYLNDMKEVFILFQSDYRQLITDGFNHFFWERETRQAEAFTVDIHQTHTSQATHRLHVAHLQKQL